MKIAASGVASGFPFRAAYRFAIAAALLLPATLPGPAQTQTQPQTLSRAQLQTPATPPASTLAPVSQAEAIQRIDAAVQHRAEAIAGYTVQELYSIYRNGEKDPSAQVTVKTTYNRDTGKDYTPISSTGSGLIRSFVIDKVLSSEKEMAKAENRERVSVTSANYRIQIYPGTVTANGRTCIAAEVRALRKETYLFNGRAWFDASDYTLVRVEGFPAQGISFVVGTTSGSRDYDRVEGFSMARQAEMKAHSFLLGDTLMKIDYSNYQIQLDPKHADNPAAPPAN